MSKVTRNKSAKKKQPTYEQLERKFDRHMKEIERLQNKMRKMKKIDDAGFQAMFPSKVVKNSTKARSYQQTDLPRLDQTVLDYLENNPEQSRTQITMGTGLKNCSVCGAVNRLIKADFVAVVGETLDPDTRRPVELLAVTNATAIGA